MVFVKIYSLFSVLIWRLGLLFLKVSRSQHFLVQRQRFWQGHDFETVTASLSPYVRKGVLFCSSAGEYEQAKPVLSRLAAQGYGCLIIFFSPSGLTYAQSRGESLPYLLAPADSWWTWQRLYRDLSPELTVVVRYELWPAFLHVAAARSRLCLIDGSVNSERSVAGIGRWVKGRLLRYFEAIFVVDQQDQEYFASAFGLSSIVTGDTKFDRVRERQQHNLEQVTSLKMQFEQLWGSQERIICGSVWRDDVSVCLRAYQSLASRKARFKDAQLVLVPHDVSSEMVAWIEDAVATETAMRCVRYSEVSGNPRRRENEVLIVDKIGMLSELYGLGCLAFVGGAFHHRVHNVLEPACYGLPLAFGPLYETSKEAVLLVSQSLARVVSNTDELQEYWAESLLGDNSSQNSDGGVVQAVTQLCGASDRILGHLLTDRGRG